MYTQEWLIGIALTAAVIGVIIGLIVGRFTLRSKHAATLERELRDANEALADYKSEVFKQFGDTAAKFEKLNESYADLHQQLASSASLLCADMPTVPMLPSSSINTIAADEAVMDSQDDTDAAADAEASDEQQEHNPHHNLQENNNPEQTAEVIEQVSTKVEPAKD